MIEGDKTGRVVKGVGGLYVVRDAGGAEYVLRARGRFRREGISPLVGDRVLFAPGQGDEHGWLREILPRTSQCTRPPAANIDLLVIVVAPEPEPDLLLADRLLVHAQQSGFEALLCVNKSDIDAELAGKLTRQYLASGVSVLRVSAYTEEGLQSLRDQMTGKLSCMAGQSAVGKSTLLNALCGLTLKTGELSVRISRGKHTTRHAELLEARGLSVLDTPGFSLMGISPGLAPEALQDWYPEYAVYAGSCRFAPCVHDREPGCAVRQAILEGKLDDARHARYLLLLEEVREAWKGRYN